MTPRRTFLTGTAAAAVGSVMPAAVASSAGVSPDAALIAACAEFDRLQAEFLETDRSAHPDTLAGAEAAKEQDRIGGMQDVCYDQMIKLRPQTMEGHRARARSLLSWAPELLDDGDYITARLSAAVLRDLAGSA